MKLEERNQSMRTFFNEKADGYDAVHAKLMDTKNALTAAIPTQAKRFLDLGIGTGLELFDLFERIPDAQVTGIDISEGMLEILKSRPFADRLTVINGNFFDVDFGNGYDAVISSSALHHFPAEDKAILYKQIFCALKPNGWFLNSDCICNTKQEETEAFAHYEANKLIEAHIDTPLSVQTETNLLQAAGFSSLHFTDLENPRYKLLIAKK
ncbi:MAG: class I SAM-dependent methyltransferase [Clostridia bacterium]|nr:class I SAM-dependent methyltransferase [Clostridia bacterium]